MSDAGVTDEATGHGSGCRGRRAQTARSRRRVLVVRIVRQYHPSGAGRRLVAIELANGRRTRRARSASPAAQAERVTRHRETLR